MDESITSALVVAHLAHRDLDYDGKMRVFQSSLTVRRCAAAVVFAY